MRRKEKKNLQKIYTSTNPSERYGHACLLKENEMYIFGGDNDDMELSDLYSLDLSSFEWTHYTPSKNSLKSPTLSSSRCFFYDKKFFVHGGYEEENFNSDLFCFDFIKNEWNLIECKNKPIGRSYHSGIIYQNFFIIFGGFLGQNQSYNNEIFYLNLNSFIWEKFETKQSIDLIPSNRSGHTSNLWKNEMIIFGGFGDEKCKDDFFSFDLIKKEWIKKNYFDFQIPLRYCHTSTLHLDNLWIFGGSNGDIDMGDLICLNLINNHSKLIESNLFSISYHSTVLYHNSLIIFGGDSKEEIETLKNDTWVYKLDYFPPFIKFNLILKEPTENFKDLIFILQ